jgi:hypothetical protein
MRVSLAMATCLLLAGNACAQLVDLDPDWKELEVPPPTKFSTERLVPIDMPRYVTVKIGVDPESLSVGTDGIIRYVVVAVSQSGNVNAMYEGLRCLQGEVKTYARFGSDDKWAAVEGAQWLPLNGNQRSMHALALARQGACDGRSASASSPETIIRKLKTSGFDGAQR